MSLDPRSPAFVRAARRGLVLLAAVNLLNYVDRYVVSGLVETLKRPDGLSLTDFQSGLLMPAFVVVLMLTSPVFGWLGDRRSRPRLVALGVGIWSLATALGGFAGSFVALFLARGLVGVGEAAYGTIAPSLIADYFPRERRGRVFSIFFAAIPIGAALGFILGGWADQAFGWRGAFFLAGAPGLLLAFLMLTLMDPPRGIQEGVLGAPPGSGRARTWKETYVPLLSNRPYLRIILGYAAGTFGIGGLAFWMPAYLERVRGLTRSEATIQFGAITAVTGLVGTYGGGVLGDLLLRRTKMAYLWFSGVTTLLGVPFMVLGLFASSNVVYVSSLVIGELLLFAGTGPVNCALVNAVRPDQRVAAIGLSIFTIHLLGDVPSPPLIGGISDLTSLRTAIWIVPGAVLLAGALWTYAAWRGESEARAPP